jgi:hypothetical protein
MDIPLNWEPNIPPTYHLTERGWSVVQRNRVVRVLTYAPLMPAALLKDENGNLVVDLLYWDGQVWKHQLVYLRQVGHTQGIRQLAAKGIPIALGSPGAFVSFLDAFFRANPGMPTGSVRSRGGWDGSVYWWGDYRLDGHVKRGGWQSPDPFLREVIRCQSRRGTEERSFALLREAMSPALALFLSAGVAAVLLRMIGRVGGFAVHLTAPSSTGKTTLMELTASFFGDPHEGTGLVRSWTDAQGWVEAWSDAPVFLDEASRVSAARVFSVVHYISTRPLVLLSNGETPIEDRPGLRGVTARTLQFHTEPFLLGSDVDRWKTVCRENYGHGLASILSSLAHSSEVNLDEIHREAVSGIAMRQQSYKFAVLEGSRHLDKLFPGVYTLCESVMRDGR